MTLLYKGEHLEKVRQYLAQIKESGKGYMITFTMTTKSGEEKAFLWTTFPDGNGRTFRIAKHLTDDHEIHMELEKTRELLRKDTLTDAYNRRALEEDLRYVLSNKRRETDPEKLIMVTIDIDNFKHFNDAYGHSS
jgi:predicted signal transduction protein with EAL and GGDEF domain